MPLTALSRVSHFRREVTGTDDYGQEVVAWTPIRVGVEVRLQGVGGQVRESPIGRNPTTSHWLRGPSGWDLRQDDGILVEAGALPGLEDRRMLVTVANDWGPRGGLHAELQETDEAFE